MKTIALPSQLPGDLDLAQINQQLRDGTAQLDWSLVIEADDRHLLTLIQGLDINDDETALGIDTLSPALGDRLTPLFTQTQKTPLINPEPKTPLLKGGRGDPSPRQLRDRLLTMIHRDLLGPAGGEFEEVDESSLTERYLVGAIAPRYRKTTDPRNQQDNLAVTANNTNDDGDSEDSAPPSSLFPASLGLSFCVDGAAEAIVIRAAWGQYRREKSESILTDKDEPKTVWRRYPLSNTKAIALQERSEKLEWTPAPEEAPAVIVTVKSRRFQGDWLLTIFLENRQTEPAKLRDGAWLFQPELKITAPDPTPIFIRRPLGINTKLDDSVRDEQEALQLLYRHTQEFAVGHNTSIHAEQHPDAPHCAHSLITRILPQYEVAQTTPPDAEEIPALAGLSLDMETLATVEPAALPALLTPLVTAYSQWLTEQEQRANALPTAPPSYRRAAHRNLQNCHQALERIQAGITCLETHPEALKAFQFMNAAMARQRVQSLYAEQRRQGKTVELADLDQPKNRSWRSFQLAFILINLPSLTDLHHPDRCVGGDRSLCDLLWFPTGGGKTEAYLGLTAYTLAIRRLQGMVGDYDGGHGVAVLMRYTLRLLTLQQFQRATTLICACEVLRREDPQTWGDEPFRIGLWVGNNSTPNWTKQSEEAIQQEKGDGYSGARGTPHQLTNCPWCGTTINPGENIKVKPFERNVGRTLVYCGDKRGQCAFSYSQAPHEGLPVITVDEEIYRRLPALVIATVDKFAQMPWNGKIQMLFGKVNGYCDRHGFRCPDLEDSNTHPKVGNIPAAKTRPHPPLRPPDLIIQDELHLISGPLGSLVGLYETAIDALCTWQVGEQTVGPKIIASTATIRQAPAQVAHLFARDLAIFPPQALDIEDNFFSRQRPPSDTHPGRLYLGICAPGRRLKAALIRVYLVALSAAQQLMDEGYNADAWMTLVGYFNSLRELGGTRRLVDDDIASRLPKMEERGLAKRYINKVEELTSRKRSTDIPRILDALEQPFMVKAGGEKTKTKQNALDVILATNMISVGVDVKRLGLMVACGQPKSTAEYIQATSRVGRNAPGLVLTVYNWARPRDLSHYERFEHYHGTFYQHVEPLSVTPFSAGALARGLPALFVALVRLLGFELNDEAGAGKIDPDGPLVQQAMAAIASRSTQIRSNPEQREALAKPAVGVSLPEAEGIATALTQLLQTWQQRAQPQPGGATLTYRGKGGTNIALLQDIAQGGNQPFGCLNSLRNVEPSTPLILNDIPPDDEAHRHPQPFTQTPR